MKKDHKNGKLPELQLDAFPVDMGDLVEENTVEVPKPSADDMPITVLSKLQHETRMTMLLEEMNRLKDIKATRLEMLGTIEAQKIQIEITMKPSVDRLSLLDEQKLSNFNRLVEVESQMTALDKLITLETDKLKTK